MAYSDDEIRDYANQLAAKGAAPAEIESFVRSAKIDQHGATPDIAPALAPQQNNVEAPSMLQMAAQTAQLPGGGNPAQLAKMAYDAGPEAAGATAGQILGSPLAEIGGVQVGGAIGGFLGNGVSQLRNMANGTQSGYKLGQALAGVPVNAMPGGSLVNSGARGILKAGVKYGAGNLAGKTIQTAVDEQRLPTQGETLIALGSGMAAAPFQKMLESGNIIPGSPEANKALFSVRDQTLKDARSAGYVIPGSRVNPSVVNKTLESVAGKAATAQDMVVKNQLITNELARKAIGLPKGEAITETAIQNVRDEAGKAYKAVADLSPEAADTLKKLGQARADSALLWKQAAMNPSPATRDAASTMSEQADAYENALEGFAHDAPANGAQLLDKMRAARVTIAKTYQVENALNKADGNISAPIIGNSFDKTNKLTDELATIGRFQQAFPAYTRPVATTPTGGVSKLKAMASGILGTEGYHVAGIPGAVIGATAPLSSDAVRVLLKSKPYQTFMAAPTYGVSRDEAQAAFGRFLTTSMGRQNDPSLDAGPLLYNNGR